MKLWRKVVVLYQRILVHTSAPCLKNWWTISTWPSAARYRGAAEACVQNKNKKSTHRRKRNSHHTQERWKNIRQRLALSPSLKKWRAQCPAIIIHRILKNTRPDAVAYIPDANWLPTPGNRGFSWTITTRNQWGATRDGSFHLSHIAPNGRLYLLVFNKTKVDLIWWFRCLRK